MPDVWHWPFLSQQPLGQEAASQTHCPCGLHSCWLPQGTQAPPLAPQAVFETVTQAPFEQQPAQPAPPQLQAPALHACPDAQLPQAAPFEPQAPLFCAEVRTHFPVESQQPPEHEVGVQPQTPVALQLWPLAQGAQVAPPAPQTVIDWLAVRTHLPVASQQPVAQEAALQTQVPVASQVCPSPHGAQLAPLLPQAVLVGVAHWPFESQQPEEQEPALQTQAPLVQVCPSPQVRHAAPFRPHAEVDSSVTQPPVESQQPFGHDVASQALLVEPPPPVEPPLAPPPVPAPPVPFVPPVLVAPPEPFVPPVLVAPPEPFVPPVLVAPPVWLAPPVLPGLGSWTGFKQEALKMAPRQKENSSEWERMGPPP